MNLKGKNISELFKLEWLETNGLGGYASSSVTGANTRKYHGFLVAALNPPTERRILIAKVEERIIQDGSYDDISVNQYEGVVYPDGHQFLNSFERRPIATWIYKGKNWKVQKKIFMVANSNTTVVHYENIGKEKFDIEIHPLLENKDYHATSKQNNFDFYYEQQKSNLKIHAYPDSTPLYVNWSKGNFIENRAWYKGIELPKEHYRGQDFVEDYYRIGYVTATLKPGEKISILCTTEENMIGKRVVGLEKKAIQFTESLKNTKIKSAFYNDLLISGNQFLVNRASTKSKSIIAGYHWFTDWGRDTMIAMRGLTIAVENHEASKSILSTFFKYLDQGMLPNRFPDYEGQEVEYNTIDATLWLFIAFYEYYNKFKDKSFINEHLKDLENILQYHINGTRFNIHVTDEGFIYGGEEGWQLTWMDARIDGYVVTPRIGCPVEINALWYNALCIYENLCKELRVRPLESIKTIKEKFNKNFRKFFLSEEGYLYDVIIPDQSIDTSFRPNQIYVVSLPFRLLTKPQEKKIVKLIGEKLLTDNGLRTLNKESEAYKGHYGGNQWERDIAYHQGTVWPFLLMEYWEAYLKVNDYSDKAKKQAVNSLKKLKDHFYNSDCIHGISEIFDGDEPKEGRGCIQQAWSVAAIVKLYTQHELFNIN
jgi:predicted glycogen debranching enzyme